MTPGELEAVLDRGLRIFPCAPEKKTPLTKHGVKDATADRAQIDEWLGQHPAANWGCAMDANTFALDIDQKNGVDGGAQLVRWIERHGELPPHLVNETPNHGRHHLFHGTGIRNSASKVAPGFDVRGAGGYIVIPPSRLSTGEYRWLDPAAPIPRAPEWLMENLLAAKSKKPQAAGPVPDGRRNDTLYRFACLLRARGMPDAEGWAALQVRNLDCAPPLDSGELEKIFQNAWKHAPGFALTDLGNAERLIAAHGADLRHLQDLGWCQWDGARWREDRESRVMVLAADVARGIYSEAAAQDDSRRKALATWAVKSESRRALEAMTALARSRPEVVDLLERYDQDPWLLGVRNGVVDLRDGAFRPAARADRMLRQADVEFAPEAAAPRWTRFLEEIFAGDAELIGFMARACGYSVTGSTAEQVLFIAHGTGANGKSTLINVLRRVLGDYAKTVQPETLMSRDRAGIPNDIARLRGVRFVPTQEIEDGKRMAESLVKQMTGGDAISARFMRQEFFDYVPVFKVWIGTNHRPVITGSDHAIWRRIRLVPFTVTIAPEQRDRDLEAKLLAESSGILNWLLAGVRQWLDVGLAPPPKVQAATEQYRRDMDRIGLFLKDRTVIGGRCRKTALYAAYRTWCEASGVHALAKMKFHEKCVDEHGLALVMRDGYEWYDVALSEDSL